MESIVRRCAVSFLSLVVAAVPARAQSSRYVSVSFGSSPVETPGPQFPAPESGIRPTLAIGYVSARGHGVELRASRLRVETMQYVYPTVCCGEAPYTVGVEATPLELGYFFQRSFLGGALRPRVGVGAIAAHVVDRWHSDTPTESATAWQFGASASAGLAVRIAGPASVVASGGYQHFSESADRPARHVGLSGRRLGVGLELGF